MNGYLKQRRMLPSFKEGLVMRYIFYLLSLFLACPLGVMATDRYVSTNGAHTEPFTNWAMAATNLKVAVDWANTNNARDTVWVSNGVHVLSTQVNVSNTVVRGISANPADVIVDGGNYVGRPTTNRCFRMNHTNALLAYLTISNGIANAGTLPIYFGGGVYIDDAGGTVSNCTVLFNIAIDGAGIGVRDNDGKIYNCLVISNNATGRGAVGFWYGGLMSDCTIVANAATGSAGGVMMAGGLVQNCFITENSSYGSDSSSYGGGGVSMGTGSTLRNCLIYKNWAKSRGALYVQSATLIQNCTIVSNRAGVGNPGGIYFIGNTCQVENTIINLNDNPQWDKHPTSASFWSFTNCCTSTDPTTNGTGNITANPQFVDVAQFNYHLASTSPCINAGVNREWMNGARDLDGHSRIDRYFRQVDIGAYEFLRRGTLISIY